MYEFLERINWKKVCTFAGGVLFGTAGLKILSSKDAKKVYTNTTAAVLRAKDCVMDQVTILQENAEDIYEGAKQINEDRLTAEVYYDALSAETENADDPAADADNE